MPHGIPIALCNTTNMSEKDWLIMRTGQLHGIPCTIGGSEVSAVFDLNPWTTSAELYDRKRHIIPGIIKEFNEDAKKRGHRFEPYMQANLVDWFKKNYKIDLVVCSTVEEFNSNLNAIYNDRTFYQCGEKDANGSLTNPQAVANIDGLIKINGKIYILEYKTMSQNGSQNERIKQYRNGIPPIYYEYQCRHYMGTLDINGAFLVIGWGFDLQDMAVIPIDRDLDLEEYIFKGERFFAQCVISNSTWDSSKCDALLLANYYTRLYGSVDPNKKPVLLSSSYFSLLMKFYERKRKREELLAEIKKMDEDDAKFISLLAPILKDSATCICRNGNESITIDIKTPMSTGKTYSVADDAAARMARLDVDKLKTEHPEVYEQFQISVFDVKSFKITNPNLFRKLKLPDEPTGETNTYTATYKVY